MKIHFITYGDKKFSKSVRRISREVKKTRIFNTITCLNQDDLPIYIKSSPLMAFDRGGGYWIWKPYIIWQELKKIKLGDILVYTDSGSTIHRSEVWNKYFNLLKNYNAIIFKYNDEKNYNWSSLNPKFVDSTKIKHWLKKSGIDYFSTLFEEDSEWYNKIDKLWAGFIIIKKVENFSLIEEWMKVMLFHPKLVMDLFAVEEKTQIEEFSSHRHDQAILTPLAYFYQKDDKICILNEDSEYPFFSCNPPVKKGNINSGNYSKNNIVFLNRITNKLKKIFSW